MVMSVFYNDTSCFTLNFLYYNEKIIKTYFKIFLKLDKTFP